MRGYVGGTGGAATTELTALVITPAIGPATGNHAAGMPDIKTASGYGLEREYARDGYGD